LLAEKTGSETAADLWEALQAGLILPMSDAYKIPLVEEIDSGRRGQGDGVASRPQHPISYRFLHDRVQQAAYSLIPDSQKKQTHLKIGSPAAEFYSGIGDSRKYL
jgi:predicted ATPase